MHRFLMISNRLRFTAGVPMTVGSFGDGASLREARTSSLLTACDLAEVRLDLLAAGGLEPDRRLWRHLDGFPLLFTARRREEGGGLESTADERLAWLETALDDAAAVDLEVASLPECGAFTKRLRELDIPLVASFHRFATTPTETELLEQLELARAAGATVFKVAAMVNSVADLAVLAAFQEKDHGFPTSTMGMGPLAPVSRLLCAQLGSVLNYGYIGETPTAPGQWSAAQLSTAIHASTMVGSK